MLARTRAGVNTSEPAPNVTERPDLTRGSAIERPEILTDTPSAATRTSAPVLAVFRAGGILPMRNSR